MQTQTDLLLSAESRTTQAEHISRALPKSFRTVWAASAISNIGTQVSALAFQVCAVSYLNATGTQMGIVSACKTAPYLLLPIVVGAIVDRLPRRAILITADLVRAALLITLAGFVSSGKLTVAGLCCGIFVLASFDLAFDAALGGYIPTLVGGHRLMAANSRLSGTLSGSELAGPAIAGYLLRVLAAPAAMIADACSFAISAVLLSGVRDHRVSGGDSHSVEIRGGILSGFVHVFRQPVLRTLAICSGAWNLSWSAVLAVLVLYSTRHLHMSSTYVGIILAATGLGGMAGAFIAARLQHLRCGKVLVFAPVIAAGGASLILVSNTQYTFILLFMAMFLYGTGESLFGVNMQTVRQQLTPPFLLARMDTAMRFCFRGMAAIGAFLGGYVADAHGVTATFTCGIAGLAATCVGLWLSGLADF